MIALIFEQEGKESVGKKVILDMSNTRGVLPVYRVNMMEIGVRDWGTMSVPTMVIINTEGEAVQRVEGWGRSQDRAKFRNILQSYVAGRGGLTSVPVPTAQTQSDTPYTVPDTLTVSRPDLVTDMCTLLSSPVTLRSTSQTWRRQSSTPSLKRSPLSQYWIRGSFRLCTIISRLSSTSSQI